MSPHRIITEDGAVIAETTCITTAFRCFVAASRRLNKAVAVEYGRTYR